MLGKSGVQELTHVNNLIYKINIYFILKLYSIKLDEHVLCGKNDTRSNEILIGKFYVLQAC